MSYKDRLKQGSFRGVPFRTESHTLTFGRRVAIHEYPFRDTPLSEDLGKKADEIKIRAYLIGEDYDLERDKLQSALNTKGAGTLVHPSQGSMLAVCTDSSMSENYGAEGRIVYFDLTFRVVGSPVTAEIDQSRLVPSVANTLKTQNDLLFSKAFKVSQDAVGAFKAATGTLKNQLRSISGAADQVSNVAFAIDEFNRDLPELIHLSSAMLAERFGKLCTPLQEIYHTLTLEPARQKRAALDGWGLFRSFGQGLTTPEPGLPALSITNPAIAPFVKIGTLMSYGNLLSDLELRSAQEGAARLAFLSDWILEVNTSQDLNLYSALRDYRLQMVATIRQKAQAIGLAQGLSIPKAQPVLALSLALGMDEQRFIDLNGIRDPLFAKGPVSYIKGKP